MTFLHMLLGFLTGAGLLVFAFCYPGIMGARTDTLFKRQEMVAALGLIFAGLCVLSLWFITTMPFGQLLATAFFN